MTRVLVGGRDRKEVLDREKKRLDSLKEENGQDPTNAKKRPTTPHISFGKNWIEHPSFDGEGNGTSYLWSENRIRKKGYERHLVPGDIPDILKQSREGRFTDHGIECIVSPRVLREEWLNVVLRKEGSGDKIRIGAYQRFEGIVETLGPHGLTGYNFDGMKTSGIISHFGCFLPLWSEHQTQTIPLPELYKICPGLFVYLYGEHLTDTNTRTYTDLTLTIKKGWNAGFLSVMRGSGRPTYTIGSLHAASRGIVRDYSERSGGGSK